MSENEPEQPKPLVPDDPEEFKLWFAQKQAEAREAKAMRILRRGHRDVLAEDDQFDLEREADQQGITLRQLIRWNY